MYLLVAVPALIVNVFCRIRLMDHAEERYSGVERLLLYAPALLLCLATVLFRPRDTVPTGTSNSPEVSENE